MTGGSFGRQFAVALPSGSRLTLRLLIRDVGKRSNRDAVLAIIDINAGNFLQARQLAADMNAPPGRNGFDPDEDSESV